MYSIDIHWVHRSILEAITVTYCISVAVSYTKDWKLFVSLGANATQIT